MTIELAERGITLAVVTYDRGDATFAGFLDALQPVLSAQVAPRELLIVNNGGAGFLASLSATVDTARARWRDAGLSTRSGATLRDGSDAGCEPGRTQTVTVVTAIGDNLSDARNLALEQARHPLLAFVDDDQRMTADWLGALLQCLASHDADAVAGPVHCRFPASAPLWLRRTDFHNTRNKVTGQPLATAGAGNCLLVLDRLGSIRFDAAYGASGAEDTDFFMRLSASGGNIRWCAEAPAQEVIADERASARYALTRFMTQGRSFRRLVTAGHGLPALAVFLLRAALQFLVAGAVGGALLLLGRPSAGDWLKKAFTNLGKLTHGARDDYSAGSRDG